MTRDFIIMDYLSLSRLYNSDHEWDFHDALALLWTSCT